MTVFELESALVEFLEQNTSELRFASNEQTSARVAPAVWSGFIPRNEVGEVASGDITTYPAVIVSAQSGNQADKGEAEIVSVGILIGCYDASLDQQGYRDVTNLVQRIKDRLREVDIIRERFPLRFPLSWSINRHYGGGVNSYPYFFAEMTAHFELPVFDSQFEVYAGTGDITLGPYNEALEPVYVEHH